MLFKCVHCILALCLPLLVLPILPPSPSLSPLFPSLHFSSPVPFFSLIALFPFMLAFLSATFDHSFIHLCYAFLSHFLSLLLPFGYTFVFPFIFFVFILVHFSLLPPTFVLFLLTFIYTLLSFGSSLIN
jgi:hypothetical protein